MRPGHKAAKENDVLAPLAEAELSKNEIRELMRFHKLGLSEKPASPCLSSRVMTGVPITEEKLRKIEEMEGILRAAGLNTFRVRHHEEGGKIFARIEVDPSEFSFLIPFRDLLVEEGRKRGYQWVLLDLAGYRMGGANERV